MAERDPIRVVHWGLGETGLAMAHLVRRRDGMVSVGAIAAAEGQTGHDLGGLLGSGERLGVTVGNDADQVLFQSRPDVTLIATGNDVASVAPQILMAMEAGSNVICVGAELAYPWATRPELADNLDELAHAHGVTVLGTGLSPGFLFDTLVIALTGCCMDVERIRAGRVGSLSQWPAHALERHGIGLSPSQWNEWRQRQGATDRGGLVQSIHLIVDSLGWRLDNVESDLQPILAQVRRETGGIRIEPGQVAGTLCSAIAHVDGQPRILLELIEQAAPEAEGIQTGDLIAIDGDPNISLRLEPEIPGVRATAALGVNMILPVLQAGVGLKTMADMPVPRAVLTDLRELMTVKGPSVDEVLARGWTQPILDGPGETGTDPASANGA